MSRLTVPSTERRQLTLADAGWSIRAAASDASAAVFTGYASKFNERTAIGNPLSWGFYEQVAEGAFTKTLAEGDARFLVDHDTRMIVSRVSAGDLKLTQDGDGLAVESELDSEVSYVRDLIRNLDKRRITGMSFGFEVLKDDWETVDVETVDGESAQAELRTIREVKLWEVSAVTFPAYDSTEASLRSVATALVHRGDLDALARHAEHKPELFRYTEGGEPGKTTRADEQEPAVSTPDESLTLSLRAYAALYGLPRD